MVQARVQAHYLARRGATRSIAELRQYSLLLDGVQLADGFEFAEHLPCVGDITTALSQQRDVPTLSRQVDFVLGDKPLKLSKTPH